MRSIHDIVNLINKELDLPGAGIFGIGQTVLRGEEKIPAIVGKNGEAVYVGIDDTQNIRLYHKLNSLTTNFKAAEAYGRLPGTIINTYSLSMVVFLNRKRVGWFADELFATIQSQYPNEITLEPYKQIRVFFNSAVLNDLQVYNQEYKSDTYRLLPEHNLFQINYTVEAAFVKGCFNNCPEE